MCDEYELDPYDEPDESVSRKLSRRSVLRGASVMAAAIGLSRPLGLFGPSPASADTLTGADAVMAAMHVHASSSEFVGSWQGYVPLAQAAGIDVVFMTDHGYRAIAYQYWQTFADIPTTQFTVTQSGAFAQQSASRSGGSFRLLAESSGTSAATLTYGLIRDKGMLSKLPTSIRGQQLALTFGSVALATGTTFEVRIPLSMHPAVAGRPAGQYELRYRFCAGSQPEYHLEGRGLIGVVTKPQPASGSDVLLDLQPDVANLWPTGILPTDNAFYNLIFAVTTPRKGAAADVTVASLQFERPRHDPDSVIADQRTIADTLNALGGPVFYQAVEFGHNSPHMNGFSVPPFMPTSAQEDQDRTKTMPTYTSAIVATLEARGGLASLNHPFGATYGPQVSPDQATAKRRATFANLMAQGLYGARVLEVGYMLRGGLPLSEHVNLWDTLSRRGLFVTGNGVNDDHNNSVTTWTSPSTIRGFATGLWAPSHEHTDLMTALRAGRVFTRHAGAWMGGQLDLLVDGRQYMGQAVVSDPNSHRLDLVATGLPVGSTVEVVGGVIDYTGQDPLTGVLASLPANIFNSSGQASTSFDASSSMFVRTQVRDSTGRIIGLSNPAYLFQTPPPGGIPPERQVL